MLTRQDSVPGNMREAPFLVIDQLHKSFGGVQALAGVEFTAHAGEVVCLVGDNGAGKSTLVKCVAGVQAPDRGNIYLDGEPVSIDSPGAAAELGIEVVYQDLTIADNLDAVQNIFLGREITDRFGRLDEVAMEEKARAALERLGAATIHSLRLPLAGYSGGQRQSVAITRSVMASARLVVLDEPTAALGVAQTRHVLELVTTLAAEGFAVIFISHNLQDVFQVADRICVMRLGKTVLEERVTAVDIDTVVRAITSGNAA